MEKDRLTREVLSDLIETATYGSGWLDFQFDDTQVAPIENEAACDTAARILLAGGKVEFIDNWAEEPDEIYSETGYFESDAGIYPVTLKDIVKGLEKAESGEWNAHDDEERNFVKEDVSDVLKDTEDSCLDMDGADWIMQVILFNEIVYY